MKNFTQALRIFFLLTAMTGVLYPYSVTLAAKYFFAEKAGGSILTENGVAIGSELLGQKFTKNQYFWSRPSAVDFNPLGSGGSNLSPASLDLKKQVEDRVTLLKKADAKAGDTLPGDLLFASASGLDPHISLQAAEYQAARVAVARRLPLQKIKDLIEATQEHAQFGVLGEMRVNVLKLNLAMDRFK